MAFAVGCLGKAEAVRTSVRISLFQVELALLTGVTGIALNIWLAETGRRILKWTTCVN
jgi:hypothetical protein